MKNNICLQGKIDHSLLLSPNPLLNFFEMRSNNKLSSQMSSQSRMRTSEGMKYDTHFIIHKMRDSIRDKPVEFDGQVELSKNALKVYIDGKLKKEISYLE